MASASAAEATYAIKTNGIQWFYRKQQKWEPFDENENELLEEAHLAGEVEVPFGQGRFPALLPKRLQKNLDAETEREILRGSWYFQSSDGRLQPFPEVEAETLEIAFPVEDGVGVGGTDLGGGQEGVLVGQDRFVYKAADCEDGVFVQLRLPSNTTRWVTSQYERGALPVRKLSPRYPQPGDRPPHDFKWWCEGKGGLWEPFLPSEDKILEKAWRSGTVDLVTLDEGRRVSVRDDLLFEGASYRKVMRAVWHWQQSGGRLQPFVESEGEALESALHRRPLLRKQDAELYPAMLGLRESLNPAAVGLAQHPFACKQGRELVAWPWMREKVSVACLDASKDCFWMGLEAEHWAALTVEDQMQATTDVVHLLAGPLAQLKTPATSAAMVATVVSNPASFELLVKALAAVVIEAAPRRLASTVSAMQRHRATVRKTLRRFGITTDSDVDVVQDRVVDCLARAVDQVRAWEPAQADANAQGEAVEEEGEEDCMSVQVGEYRTVFPAVEGGFVQLGKGAKSRRAVVRGYQGGVLAVPDALTPRMPREGKSAVGAEKREQERNEEAETKEEQESATLKSFESNLLALAGPGKQPIATQRLDLGDGTGINYCQIGDTGPALLLLHGFGGGLALWAQNFSGLSGKFRVYALDLPGHGGSGSADPAVSGGAAKSAFSFPWFSTAATLSSTASPDSAEAAAARAEARLVEPIERWRKAMCSAGHDLGKVSVVGHGLGAYVGVCYALQHPDVVGDLLLAEPWGLTAPGSEQDTSIALPLKQRIHMCPTLIVSHATESAGAVSDSAVQTLCDSFVSKVRMRRPDGARMDEGEKRRAFLGYLEHCSQHTDSVSPLWLHGNPLWAARPLLPRLQAKLASHVKITAVYGTQTWVDASAGMELGRAMPAQCFVAVIPGAGHHVYAESPKAFNEAVISRLEAARGGGE